MTSAALDSVWCRACWCWSQVCAQPVQPSQHKPHVPAPAMLSLRMGADTPAAATNTPAAVADMPAATADTRAAASDTPAVATDTLAVPVAATANGTALPAAGPGTPEERIRSLDLQLTYLWRVHGVDYYAGAEVGRAACTGCPARRVPKHAAGCLSPARAGQVCSSLRHHSGWRRASAAGWVAALRALAWPAVAATACLLGVRGAATPPAAPARPWLLCCAALPAAMDILSLCHKASAPAHLPGATGSAASVQAACTWPGIALGWPAWPGAPSMYSRVARLRWSCQAALPALTHSLCRCLMLRALSCHPRGHARCAARVPRRASSLQPPQVCPHRCAAVCEPGRVTLSLRQWASADALA